MSDGRFLAFAVLAALATAGQVRQGSAARRKWGSPPPKKRGPRRKPIGRHALSWAPPKKKLVGTTQQGDPIWQTKRPVRGRGATVNPTLSLPDAPGPWVDLHECTVCGETYAAFNSGVSFEEGVARIRQAAGWQAGGGFRTPGPVLWAMRTIKAERWYMEHYMCGAQYSEHQRMKRQRVQWQHDHAQWQRQMEQWQTKHPQQVGDHQRSAASYSHTQIPPEEPILNWAWTDQPEPIPF